MPTGTGKTITLLSLITSYQIAHPEIGKLIYCTRTVPEMEKVSIYTASQDTLLHLPGPAYPTPQPPPQVLSELKQLVEYRAKYFQGKAPEIMALGLSSRKNLCVNTKVVGEWRGRPACTCALGGPRHTWQHAPRWRLRQC